MEILQTIEFSAAARMHTASERSEKTASKAVRFTRQSPECRRLPALPGDETSYRVIMDVDIAIRYSDDRLCEVILARPGEIEPFYRIVGRR